MAQQEIGPAANPSSFASSGLTAAHNLILHRKPFSQAISLTPRPDQNSSSVEDRTGTVFWRRTRSGSVLGGIAEKAENRSCLRKKKFKLSPKVLPATVASWVSQRAKSRETYSVSSSKEILLSDWSKGGIFQAKGHGSHHQSCSARSHLSPDPF